MDRSPYMEIDATGAKVGANPLSQPKGLLKALGHPESPLKAIRAHCIECSGNNMAEVRRCTAITCALWPMRMGKNPFHAKAAAIAPTSTSGPTSGDDPQSQ